MKALMAPSTLAPFSKLQRRYVGTAIRTLIEPEQANGYAHPYNDNEILLRMKRGRVVVANYRGEYLLYENEKEAMKAVMGWDWNYDWHKHRREHRSDYWYEEDDMV